MMRTEGRREKDRERKDSRRRGSSKSESGVSAPRKEGARPDAMIVAASPPAERKEERKSTTTYSRRHDDTKGSHDKKDERKKTPKEILPLSINSPLQLVDLDEDSTILAPVETGDIETAIFRAAPYEGVAASAKIPTERVSSMAPCVDPRRKPSAALGAPPPVDTVQPPPQEDWKQYMRDTIRESLADIVKSGLLATPEAQAAPSRRREEERHDSPRRREDRHHESPRRWDERRPEDRRSESPRYMRNEVLLPAHVVRDEDQYMSTSMMIVITRQGGPWRTGDGMRNLRRIRERTPLLAGARWKGPALQD